MKTRLLTLATLLLIAGLCRTTLAQLPAGAKIQGIYQSSQVGKPKASRDEVSPVEYTSPAAPQAAAMQPAMGYSPQMMMQYPAAPSGVQVAGHHHGAYADCPPGYAGGPHSYGGGTFPYGSEYDRGHPGKPFDGGRYGYFGGAHRTPGYPRHHHMNREYVGPQGPPTAQVAYPYYTVRGPRDFFMDNPPSIGR